MNKSKYTYYKMFSFLLARTIFSYILWHKHSARLQEYHFIADLSLSPSFFLSVWPFLFRFSFFTTKCNFNPFDAFGVDYFNVFLRRDVPLREFVNATNAVYGMYISNIYRSL